MSVFVIDRRKKPLMPCSEKRARQLLERGRARVHKVFPFTIRLIDRYLEDSVVPGVTVKIDPGSKESGGAVVRKVGRAAYVLQFFDLIHRGAQIHKKMQQRAAYRRRRRSANLRYRAPRFDNRRRREDWLAPSIRHRVDTTISWVRKLTRIAPLNGVVVESVKFDTQKLQNPEISGIEYQRGELFGYETKEYLLEKWGRACAYCGKEHVPLEVEHIAPKSRGGSDRVFNLTLACHECNQKKGNRLVEEFLADRPELLKKIKAKAKAPLKDAAAVNCTRKILVKELQKLGLPVETGTGGQTKYNRIRLVLPKEHWIDALCVGKVDEIHGAGKRPLFIKCMGRGSHQRTRVDSHGFPRGYMLREKQVRGFSTGDMVEADVTKGKKRGLHKGRVAIRKSGSFNIQTADGVIQGISWKYCRILNRADGYSYQHRKNNGGSASFPV